MLSQSMPGSVAYRSMRGDVFDFDLTKFRCCSGGLRRPTYPALNRECRRTLNRRHTARTECCPVPKLGILRGHERRGYHVIPHSGSKSGRPPEGEPQSRTLGSCSLQSGVRLIRPVNVSAICELQPIGARRNVVRRMQMVESQNSTISSPERSARYRMRTAAIDSAATARRGYQAFREQRRLKRQGLG